MSVFDQYLCQLVCRSGIFHLYAVKQLIFIMIMDKKRRYVALSNFSEQADIWIGKRGPRTFDNQSGNIAFYQSFQIKCLIIQTVFGYRNLNPISLFCQRRLPAA